MLQEIIFYLLRKNNRPLSRLIQFSKIQFITSPSQLILGIFAPEKYLEIFELKFPEIIQNIRIAVPFEVRLYVLGDTMINVSFSGKEISNYMVATQERIEQTQEAVAVAAAEYNSSNQEIVNLSGIPKQWREAILEEVRLAHLPVFLGENGNFDLPLESYRDAWSSLRNRVLQADKEESSGKPASQKQPKGKRLMAKLFNGDDVKGGKNRFIETLQNFLQKIRSQIKLTPQETKLCAYLRMNMSTKDIANLMNISIRGVELARYRLRKKLGLEREINLSEYLSKI